MSFYLHFSKVLRCIEHSATLLNKLYYYRETVAVVLAVTDDYAHALKIFFYDLQILGAFLNIESF